jgi:GntR family transcriptional regulator, rspAB operon transcriptional repressor
MDQTGTTLETNEILRRRSLTDEVYDYLYEKIIAGKYTAGDWLRQDDISTQLGVSQTPVREALDRLVTSGLAERVPFRGVRVPKLESKEIIDAFILRMVLENIGARLASLTIQPEQIQGLTEIVEQTSSMTALEDMSTLRQLNKEFHSRIVEAAGSSLLNKLYEIATNSFPDWMLYEYLFRHPELLQSSLNREYLEHKAIVEALSRNDPRSASEKVLQHIKNLGDELEIYLDISGNTIQEMESLIDPMI